MASARLHGKNILVTGASRGIGAGIAKLVAAQGARVALTYTSKPELAEQTLKSLAGDGHFVLPMSLTDSFSIEMAFNQALDKFGQLHGLVNNAGVTKDQLLLRMKDEDFDAVIQANLKGTFICTRHATKAMLKAKTGSIVNITSVIGHSGNPGQTNYAASKAGIEGFTRSAALEVGSRSIRLNCVAPGFIVTDMTDALDDKQKQAILAKIPLQRLGNVDDVANAVVYLLSDESSYMTGQTLHINGGMYM